MKNKIVAIDFDNTLSQYEEWKGKFIYGKPVKGAVDACWRLKDSGAILIVWTCRNGEDTQIHSWLKGNGFPDFDGVNKDLSGLPDRGPKIYADVYIDDRSPTWSGWEDALAWIDERYGMIDPGKTK